jgi:pimeloyl-ACP methyl ester carboxylesterase
LILIGHSLGCVPILKLLARDGDRFAGGVLMAPASDNRNIVGPAMLAVYEALHAVASQAQRLFGVHLRIPYQFTYRHLYADPEAVRRGQADGFLQRSLSLLSYPYLIPSVDNVAVAAGVTVPALVVVGSEDQIVANGQSRATYDALAATDKEWVRVVGSGHSMLGDRGAGETMAVIGQWVQAHAGQP